MNPTKEVAVKIKSLTDLNNYILKIKDENILPPSLYVLDDDIYLEQSLSKFYNYQLKKIEMLNGFKLNHTELEELNDRIANHRKDLLIYIDNSISAMNLKIDDVENEVYFIENWLKKCRKQKKI